MILFGACFLRWLMGPVKHSQETWKFLEDQGIPDGNVVLTIADADSDFHHLYFEALTHHFVKASHRGKRDVRSSACIAAFALSALSQSLRCHIHMRNLIPSPLIAVR